MTLDITQFYQGFFDEAEELLAQMERLLLALDIANPDPEDLAAIFRAAHSIKGGAATFGFASLTDTTHILESLLDRARNDELVLHRDMIDTFLATKDVLSGQITAYRASAEPDEAAAASIRAKLERLKSGAGQAESTPALEPAFVEANSMTVEGTQNERALGKSNLPAAHVSNRNDSTNVQASAGERQAATSAEGSSIRVGVEKVDQLINLVGELVITQAMLAETTSTF
ncbi:Hpt domain-containing protein, partial [Caballeronia sp. LZ029]|uniref:Hpt domain-containing protein n=1 Tax=Caballeronia sp. LZ029 TaxID=3038564 RepID=UPI0028610E91